MTEITNSKLVVFNLGNEEFGFLIEQVESIEVLGQIRTLPNLPSYVCGVVNLRGSIVPIVDLVFLLTNHKESNLEGKKIIIVRRLNGLIGFIVDEAKEVIDFTKDMLQKTTISLGEVEHSVYLVKMNNRLINLLDADTILMGQTDCKNVED